MRKGKGLKVTALVGAVSSLFAGAALAAAPAGFRAGNFSASSGTISNNCSSMATTGYTVSCSPAIANGFGFLQEIITISDGTTSTDYIHTVVTDQNATFSAGAVGAGTTAGFTDETLVKFTTNQGVQTNPNQNGIWGQQRIFEKADSANLNTDFTSKTDLSMGWANPSGTDAVVIKQAVSQANTRGTGTTVGDRFKTTFDYFADVTTNDTTGVTTRTGYSTNIAQLVGLNNAPNGTEGDIQSFRLMQVSGSRNGTTTTQGRLPLMSGMSTNSVDLTGGPNGTNQAMWLGQKISVTSTASMEFGYQAFDNLTDGLAPSYYYNLSSAQPANISVGGTSTSAWTAAGKFDPAPTLNNPLGSGTY